MLREAEVNASRWIAVVWAVVAVLLAMGSVAGGDTSIVTGFVWLAWTAPIGMIWQFWLYDSVLRFLGPTVTNWIGLAVVLVGTYAFWFVVIPRIIRAARARSGQS